MWAIPTHWIVTCVPESYLNTPRAFACGVPRQGFYCARSGGTENRPPSHRFTRAQILPCHGQQHVQKNVSRSCSRSHHSIVIRFHNGFGQTARKSSQIAGCRSYCGPNQRYFPASRRKRMISWHEKRKRPCLRSHSGIRPLPLFHLVSNWFLNLCTNTWEVWH